MKIIIGSSATVAAAAIGPQSSVRFEIKLETRIGIVLLPSPAIMTGIKNSFHESRATNTPVATKPGVTSGINTFVNSCRLLAPSTRAASSISISEAFSLPNLILFLIEYDSELHDRAYNGRYGPKFDSFKLNEEIKNKERMFKMLKQKEKMERVQDQWWKVVKTIQNK